MVPALMLILSISGHRVASGQSSVKQGPAVPVNFCIDADEMELFLLINEYRQQYGLPPIPLSKSLCRVAVFHAKDLFLNHPEDSPCNFHSWSDKGFWTPFCYPKDESKKNSVWDKPRELTKYPSRAYEIVYWENHPLVRDTIIMVWKMEEYFNDFLLNKGRWQGKTWNAIGIAVYETYACAWFGEAPDPEGEAVVCGSQPVKKVREPAVTPLIPSTSVATGDSVSSAYYIIVKTNLTEDAANKLVNTLKTGEYPGADILKFDGKIRVSVFGSPDRATVTAKLKEVKKTYKDAWLLKR
ncbi:MAG: CAP domain-containing protein [Bacteroidales bacterium]|nr:CAP domain-containing protein [Bacteroidales bacterium]